MWKGRGREMGRMRGKDRRGRGQCTEVTLKLGQMGRIRVQGLGSGAVRTIET